MPEGGGHFGLALAGAATDGQPLPGAPRRRMARAAAVSLVLHGVVVTALLVGLAHQNRNVDAGETPATVELVMSPPGSRETTAPSTAPTRATPNKPAAAPAPPAPPTQPPAEAKPTVTKAPPTPPKTAAHPPPAFHPPAAAAPVAPPPPAPPTAKAEPALPLPPATVPAPTPPSAASETPAAKASPPAPSLPAPSPPAPLLPAPLPPEAAEPAKPDVTQAPAPEPTTSAAASASPMSSQPAAAPDAAPASQQKLSFNLGGAASDTNALVTGDMLMPPTADPKFRNRKPSYPPEAAQRGEEGAVVLMIHVAPDGLVSGVDIAESSGFGLLDQAARKAALSWHFLPAVRNGHPVSFDMPLRIKFSLY